MEKSELPAKLGLVMSMTLLWPAVVALPSPFGTSSQLGPRKLKQQDGATPKLDEITSAIAEHVGTLTCK